MHRHIDRLAPGSAQLEMHSSRPLLPLVSVTQPFHRLTLPTRPLLKATRLFLNNGEKKSMNFWQVLRLAGRTDIESITSSWQSAHTNRVIEHLANFAVGGLKPGQQIDIITQSASATATTELMLKLHTQPNDESHSLLAKVLGNVIYSSPAGFYGSRRPIGRVASIVGGVARQQVASPRALFTHLTPTEQLIANDESALRLLSRFLLPIDRQMAINALFAFQGDTLSLLARDRMHLGLGLILGAHDQIMQAEGVLGNVATYGFDCIHVSNNGHGIGTSAVLQETLDLLKRVDETRRQRQAGKDIGPLQSRTSFGDGVTPKMRGKVMRLISKV